jgi:hypothetical protein
MSLNTDPTRRKILMSEKKSTDRQVAFLPIGIGIGTAVGVLIGKGTANPGSGIGTGIAVGIGLAVAAETVRFLIMRNRHSK